MDTTGVDLHKRESQLRIITLEGELIERRIVTSPAALYGSARGAAPARILLEASTESEWVTP